MKTVLFHELEQVSKEDLNNLQKSIHQSLYDHVLHGLFKNESGCIGGGFFPERLSETEVNVSPGMAFFYDPLVGEPNPKYQAVLALESFTVEMPEAPAGSDLRRDIIVIRQKREEGDPKLRWVKLGTSGNIEQQTINKSEMDLYEVDVVEGTPHVSTPVAPETPEGWLKIAEVIQTGSVGIAAGDDVIDTRNILKPEMDIRESFDRYVDPNGGGTDTTLQAALANLPDGGTIIIVDDIEIDSVHAVPDGTKIVGKSLKVQVIVTAGGRIDLGENCEVSGLRFVTEESEQTFLKAAGDFCFFERLHFDAPADGENTFIELDSDANHISKCRFKKVIEPANNIGIKNTSGVENTEENNIFE